MTKALLKEGKGLYYYCYLNMMHKLFSCEDIPDKFQRFASLSKSLKIKFIFAKGPRWPSNKVSALEREGSRFETLSPRPRSALYLGLLRVESDIVGQTPSSWCGVEV
ncbi:hypothetical protein AVEN_192910-1 [Araneus ventricosus]|uniref:Uncharacterized protein n=1 Tax=Araneus ventricosus TaxID=182803 RepID=A0A4Y2JLJ2_ARAVE|nr:hypothetical protein AVEN_192910-1 [Araneus ventricosus]